MEFNILSDTVVHGWITAYDRDYNLYSPGHHLMLAVICDMENTGHVFCDVGAGDHAYKKYYESLQFPAQQTVLRTGLGTRPFATSWVLAETHAPDRVSRLMARARRRGDQIFACELSLADRLTGLATAFNGSKGPR